MQRKKKILMLLIIAIIFLIVAVIFLEKNKGGNPPIEKSNDNIYMAGNLDSNHSRDMSVYKNGKTENLGYSLNGYVHYFSNNNSYLLQNPKDDEFELIMVDSNLQKKNLGTYKLASINIKILDEYIIIPISGSKIDFINVNDLNKYNVDLSLNENGIIHISNNNVFFQNDSGYLCYLNLETNKINQISNNQSLYVSVGENNSELVFIDSEGIIYYYDIQNLQITKDLYKAIPNEILSLSTNKNSKVKNISINKKNNLVYEYAVTDESNIIIEKEKNAIPQVFEMAVSKFRKVNDYYFYSLKNFSGKYITEVLDSNMSKLTSVISYENINIDTIEQCDSDAFYALTNDDYKNLYKIKLSGKNILVASGVSQYIYQNGNLAYVKTISRSTDPTLSRANMYDIYLKDTEVYKGAIYCSVSDNSILYKTTDNEFYLVHDGINDAINIDAKNYAYISNTGNNINMIVPVENCKFNLSDIEGYWKKTTKTGEYYCLFNKYGEEVISGANTKNYITFNSLKVKDTTYNSMILAKNEQLTMINENEFVNQEGDTWRRISKSEFDSNASRYINSNGAWQIADYYFANSDNTLEKSFADNGVTYYIYRNNIENSRVIISEYGECYSYKDYINNKTFKKEIGWEYTGKYLKSRIAR